jgi:hypothetical protein
MIRRTEQMETTMIARNRRNWLALLLASLGICLSSPAFAAEPCTWVKLADPPKDVAGRESPPGTDGAWVYVPEWKGFLLYGGTSPTYSNEGWFFDPDKREWTLLWPHDSLVKTETGWKVSLPRDQVWSLDRPAPARAHGVAYDSARKQVVFFGGHPTADHARNSGDPRLTRESWLGPAKLGTWTLDPATAKFRHLTETGPAGISRGVYDSANQLVVAMPMRRGPHAQNPEPPGLTWVYTPAKAKWDVRTSPAAPRPFQYSGFTFDAKAKKCIYFNGYGETWTYDAVADVWTDAKPAQAPPPRRHAAFCYDEARGVSILHGGVHHPRSGPEAFSIHASHNGIHLADTWCYDAARNEWSELKPDASPPKASTARDPVAYDSDRKTVVLYDVSTGVWALRFKGEMPSIKATLPAAAVQAAAPKSRGKPPADPSIKAWQDKLKNLPDNTWLDLGIPVPAQGCKNISFDPVNHCLVMLGGCGGPMFATADDYGYNNQIWMLDMQVGKYALRRAHHVWGPLDTDYRSTRMGPGCTRGSCFDSIRNVLWTSGGNGWSGVGTTHLQSYDVATDRFSTCAPAGPWGDGECGMFVHDPKNDLLVYTDGRRHKKTYIYDPKQKTWTDGGPVPLTTDETLTMFSSRVYDPEVGIVAIFPTVKDWKIGDPPPAKGAKLEQLGMRTFAYDVKTRKWRDLAPKNEDKLPYCGMPGVAYDSRNRQVLLLKSDHGDIQPLDPKVPYGTLWTLDLASNTWQEAPSGPNAKLNLASMAYDPNLNLAICRFGHKGLWVYRRKGDCPADAFTREH